MADPVTLSTASKQLVNELFNTSIWNTTRYLLTSDGHIISHISQNISQLVKVGFGIGFFVALVQVLADIAANTYGNGIHPIKTFLRTIIRIVFVALLMTPPIYSALCIRVIAGPCNKMAESISVTYSDNLLDKLSSTFDVVGDSGGKKGSIWTSAFWEQMTSSFLATIIYVVAAAFTFIMPILQSALFLFAFYLGPLCLPFMLCDITSSIAKSWLSLTLTSAFMSVIGSLSFMVADSANVISKMQSGGGWENVLIVLVYGIITIALFAMSYPIAAFLFNASGVVGSLMNPASSVSFLAGNALSLSAIAAGAGSAFLRGGANIAGKRGNKKVSNALNSMSDKLLGGADMFDNKGRGTYRNAINQRRRDMSTDSQANIHSTLKDLINVLKKNASSGT